MDYDKLITRYIQFGGIRLVWQYAKLGILPIVIKCFVRCVAKRQSFKGIYPEVLKRIEPYLIERFQVSKFKIQTNRISHEHPKVIWWCWLQGLENAPKIVTACYYSLRRNLPEYEIRVIEVENWKQYVQLPDYIVKKWEKKQIPPALFSDLLRLQLLIKYGGTWIDSTVLCTGFKSSKVQEYKKYLDVDLFMFQYTQPDTTEGISISNWFITAYSNNEVLMALRDMLFAYWKDNNCTLDYYIFHLFFKMVSKEFPEQIAAMPYGYSMNSLVLLHHWGEKYDQKKWDKLTSMVAFHKLNYRVSQQVLNSHNTFYHSIVNNLL